MRKACSTIISSIVIIEINRSCGLLNNSIQLDIVESFLQSSIYITWDIKLAACFISKRCKNNNKSLGIALIQGWESASCCEGAMSLEMHLNSCSLCFYMEVAEFIVVPFLSVSEYLLSWWNLYKKWVEWVTWHKDKNRN